MDEGGLLLARPFNRTSMLIPNHGLGFLATALRRGGYEPGLVDCIRDRLEPEGFARLVAEQQPGAVGFQVFTFDLPAIRAHLDRLKGELQERALLLGGVHPTADPAGTWRLFPEADFLFVGEAEEGLPRLMDLAGGARGLKELARRGPPELAEIPGLAWRRDGELQQNPRSMVLDLDSLGLPAWDLIAPASYPYAPQGTFLRRTPFAPIIATRGCPYRCAFCAGFVVAGRRLRKRSVGHLLEEIDLLVREHGVREIHIQDDNFTFHREYVLEFCAGLRRLDHDLVWALPNGARLDSLDPEVLRAMEDAGCYSMAVGIESGSQRILDLMHKETTLAEIEQRLRLIRRTTRIYVTGFFVLGFPGETRAEMERTIRFSRRLDLDKVNYGILMPLPATEVYNILRERGLLGEEVDWSRMSEYRSPYTPEGFTQRDFRYLFAKAFILFYMRPRIMLRLLRQIRSWDQVQILWRRFLDVVRG